MNNRNQLALSLLQKYFPQKEFRFLGEGKSSLVFTDSSLVFKVFLFDHFKISSYKINTLDLIKSVKHKFENSCFFYPVREIIEITDKRFILVYSFEDSEPCKSFEHTEIEDFLVECWKKKIIFQDIKPKNFIRVNGKLKWIDYEPDGFTDNLFLNMACRAFIYAEYSSEDTVFLKKLCRSAINQFDLPELEKFPQFCNRLFAKIIYEECNFQDIKKISARFISDIKEIQETGNFFFPHTDNFNPEKLYWQLIRKNFFIECVTFDLPFLDFNNCFSPKNILCSIKRIEKPKKPISLIVKACVQDVEIIYEATKHIIKQLAFPNSFDEIILALDTRQNNFLREYNSGNSWNQLIQEAQKLVDDMVIHKFIFPNENDILAINKQWLGIETGLTHTEKKSSLTPHLFAFQTAKNDYILQIDCDVMIGRLSKEHSFLNDMIDEFEKNKTVLSVGFNIYKGKEHYVTNYFGFENGGFVPEVRFCLLKKSRIKAVLPLKNELMGSGFKLSWYRSLELMQKENGQCSIRGGDSRSFFIHPQNFKKADKDVWFTTLDRVEQLQIPSKQVNEFDLAGSYYDWTIPKRNENLVVVCCFKDISLPKFLRFWYSLISQSYRDWGLILVDDASENGINYFIEGLLEPYKEKITFIRNRFQVGIAQNTYKAIHYFTQNPESVLCILNANDALIGKDALENIYDKYDHWEADVVIGKTYQANKVQADYDQVPNFIHPRFHGSHVWQHLKTFKKYLFDNLDFNDLKIASQEERADDMLLARRFSQRMKFPKYHFDAAYMIPIIEMSKNPMCVNQFNLFLDNTPASMLEDKTQEESVILEILSKPGKSSKNIVKGRKIFLPNLKKIEIDITYECNLKCTNCSRSSTQAPTEEGMTVKQIEQFIVDSIDLDKKWELINLLGGEPTLHRNFLEIVDIIIFQYIEAYSAQTILQVTSNGFGEIVQEKLNALPDHPNLIVDYASFKESRVIPYFSPFNDAPIDKLGVTHSEYYKGCWVTSYCGVGLNRTGYYPCGNAGGIDRIFQFNLGVTSLRDVDENISTLLNMFCPYCGNFSDYEQNRGDFIPRHEKAALNEVEISESWKRAYRKYNGK